MKLNKKIGIPLSILKRLKEQPIEVQQSVVQYKSSDAVLALKVYESGVDCYFNINSYSVDGYGEKLGKNIRIFRKWAYRLVTEFTSAKCTTIII